MKTLIRNIGLIVSGDIERPLLEGDSIAIADGRIVAVGKGLEDQADTVIDAKGSAVIPGLIDSHCHPVFGDFTPRQRTVDFIESGLNGGLTTMISAGEVHLPGRPKDIVGLKALAVVAAKAYANLRPAGVKVHGGAPILELGMVEDDFAEMARHGVKLVGEIGLGSVKTGKDAAPMVRWAKKHGMTALYTLERARDARALHRIIIGNDAPSGTGVVPLGILRVIAHLASLGGLAPEAAICMATGNTARVYGLPVGVIEAGREADLCVVDAPIGSVGKTALDALRAGDLFGISMVLIDGQIKIGRSRNTPPAARAAEVVKGHGPSGGG